MSWLKNLSTRSKLLSAFSMLSAVLLVVAGVGYFGLRHLHEEVETLNDVHLVGIVEILEADADLARVARDAMNAMVENDPAARADFVRSSEAGMSTLASGLAATEKTLVTDEGKASLATVRQKYESWSAEIRRALALAEKGHGTEGIEIIHDQVDQASDISAGIAAVRDGKIRLSAQAAIEAAKVFDESRNVLMILLVLSLAFATFTSLTMSGMIASPLGRAATVLAQVSEGDFTQHLEVHSNDEMGRLAASLNTTILSMRRALLDVGQSARSVASASRQLTGAAQGISSGAQEQASSLEETAASLEEMTSTVKQNADNAQQAAQLAQGAREVAEKGGHVVGTAVNAMKEINDASRRIADIITTIDEIAFQTNLLALNAAVEAARAGEQGRGFAVVAGEVRNLAQRSATAAKEIKGLIQDTVEKVEAGSRLVNQSGQTLDEIVVSVRKVTDLIGEIAAASREQSTGIDQVNTAVTQMDAVTQSNASQTEELAGTSEALASQAQQMMALVERFRLGEEGGHAPVATAAPRHAPSASAPAARREPKLVAIAGGRREAAPARAAVKIGTHDDFEEF